MQKKLDDRITIRGLSPDLYQKARIAALKAHKNVGDLYNQAITAYLKLK